ncbi:TOBE domain-containing protein [Caulobacter sp. HMWF009]|uniref:TOBE domain-containing protein n=1 Tax=Caulobacter sp. HMWF009 TaxID=2056846 RepID=UPI000D347B20|nr:TOBE domain-containing protein [Caulobacter sp. HMWF009]PTS90315.1 molybdenum-dependent transcriptional regulator [Caulobacter sp. HMWF009]
MTADGELRAALILRRGALARVGMERIDLLEAVGAQGSITAAARTLGLSYKGAWDAIQALNNLFDGPLILASPGGRAGGTAEITARGQTVIRAFRAVEREIGAAVARLEVGLSAAEAPDLGQIFWSLGLRTSARNALRGTVSGLAGDRVTAEVTLAIGEGREIVSTITRRSAEDLALRIGSPVLALIKSSVVAVGPGAAEARNRLACIVTAREDGESASELTLALGGGKTLVATVPRSQTPCPEVGAEVMAGLNPADIILAVE